LFIAVVVILPRAYGQANFTLAASAPYPSAVDPGGSSISTITVGTINNISSGSVALSCTVAPLQTNGATCSILSSVTPPATPTLTITTTTLTPPTLYTITVTGTVGTSTLTVPVNLSVLAVTPAYTLSDTTPNPSSVHAGSAATATVTATPISGYSGSVTFSCSTISPTVTPAPVCSFNPPTVTVTNSAAASSTLTISTTGPSATRLHRSTIFYALWLPLALIGGGLSTTSRLWKKLLGWLLLGMIVSGIMVTIGCGNSTSSSTTSTPNNTYTFTLSAIDQNKAAPSNGILSISLTVN
jgi:trimeric autotransporter adhesin